MNRKTNDRSVLEIYPGLATSDGAGVRLTRYIGSPQLDHLDPFLLLDFFQSDNPDDYIAGFPSHPHRGFETVNYLLAGRVRHEDNTGHAGIIEAGGIQWMSAGRGIVHSEMPEQKDGQLAGFQLWINLPAAKKMAAPRYQEFSSREIPVESRAQEVEIRVIAGDTSFGTQGPVRDVSTRPIYLDIALPPGQSFYEPVPADYTAFVFVIDGPLWICGRTTEKDMLIAAKQMATLETGGRVHLVAENAPARCLLICGQPLKEPIARYGPFVMNTREEVLKAAHDFQSGNF
jgi:hypothetical protein